MSYFLGYGHNVWAAGNYYFWVSSSCSPGFVLQSRADKLFQVPMVAPFCGCTFGGFLYDLLIFTGESPINTPYLGLYRFIPGLRDWEWEDEKTETVEESPV